MVRDPTSVRPLLRQAARLKAAGYSWESIARELRRAPRTVRQWPERHRDEWDRLLCDAEDRLLADVSQEALVFLRKLQRSEDERVSSQVNRYLHSKRLETRRRPPPVGVAGWEEAWKPLVQQVVAMGEEEQEQFARDFVERNAASFGFMPIPATVASSTTEAGQLQLPQEGRSGME
jgi:Putative ATPase subunit of terminase (gpP-like)